MTLNFRFATLLPAPGQQSAYLSEPIYIDGHADMRQIEIDFRSQVSGVEGAFQTSRLFNSDAECKKAIKEKEAELKKQGFEVMRVSVYDNEVL